MHEISIAERIISTVESYIPPGDSHKVNFVEVRVGKFSNVLIESLLFCYKTLVENTPLENSYLKIITPPIKLFCKKCEAETETDGLTEHCPICGSQFIEVSGADELTISNIILRD